MGEGTKTRRIQLINRWFFSLGRGWRRVVVVVVVVGVVEDTGNAPATASSAPLLYLSLLWLHSFPPSPWRPVASVTALPPAALPVRVTLGFLRGEHQRPNNKNECRSPYPTALLPHRHWRLSFRTKRKNTRGWCSCDLAANVFDRYVDGFGGEGRGSYSECHQHLNMSADIIFIRPVYVSFNYVPVSCQALLSYVWRALSHIWEYLKRFLSFSCVNIVEKKKEYCKMIWHHLARLHFTPCDFHLALPTSCLEQHEVCWWQQLWTVRNDTAFWHTDVSHSHAS